MYYRKLPRLVVSLIYQNGAFYNSRGFKNYEYLGDPLNIIQLLNSKNCMEAAILNLDDTIDFREFSVLASEAFMPMSYGGAINSLEDATKLISMGFEKVILKDTEKGLDLAREVVAKFGSQAVCICVNINDKRKLKSDFIKRVFMKGVEEIDLVTRIKLLLEVEPGDLLIQDIMRDGCECGLNDGILPDLANLKIPVLLSGGLRGFQEILSMNEKYPWLNFAGSTSYTFKNGGILVNYPIAEQLNLLKQV